METEELKQEKLHKLQSQVRALEGALAEHREKLERMTAMEERRFQDKMKQMGEHHCLLQFVYFYVVLCFLTLDNGTTQAF